MKWLGLWLSDYLVGEMARLVAVRSAGFGLGL
jgi:hypothetical protein